MDLEFRIWDVDNNNWTNINGHMGIENRNFKIFYLKPKYLKINVEITQGIGHKDIDKKKIFVGDWVENTDEDGKEIYLILHDDDKLIARRYMIDIRCHCENCIDGKTKSDCWTYEDLRVFQALFNPKIVGNMFEHPNLYKER